jgi:hypothetical protein
MEIIQRKERRDASPSFNFFDLKKAIKKELKRVDY